MACEKFFARYELWKKWQARCENPWRQKILVLLGVISSPTFEDFVKEEAIKLENRCDKLMSGYLGRDSAVSLALTGRLKIVFDDGDYITWDMVEDDADYINYTGYYGGLLDDISMIQACIADNRVIFEQLVWSYNHRRKLEE